MKDEDKNSVNEDKNSAIPSAEPKPTAESSAAPTLCPVHQEIEDFGNLEIVYGNNCVACSLNERDELLEILATVGDTSKDSVTALREVVDFWGAHHGDGRVVVSYPAPSPLGQHGVQCNVCGLVDIAPIGSGCQSPSRCFGRMFIRPQLMDGDSRCKPETEEQERFIDRCIADALHSSEILRTLK
jgi:hypothetical protein